MSEIMAPSPSIIKNKRKTQTSASTSKEGQRSNKEDEGPKSKKPRADSQNGSEKIQFKDNKNGQQRTTAPAVEPADYEELESSVEEYKEVKPQPQKKIEDKAKWEAKYRKYGMVKPANIEIDILEDPNLNHKTIKSYMRDLVNTYMQYIRWGGPTMETMDKIYLLPDLIKYYVYMKKHTKCMVVGCKNKNNYFYSNIIFYNKRVVCSACMQLDNPKHYIPNSQANALFSILDKMLDSYKDNFCAFFENNCQRLGVVRFWPRHELFCKHQTTHCPFPICSTSTTPRKSYYYYELEDHIKTIHEDALLPENETLTLMLDFVVVLKRKAVFVVTRKLLNKQTNMFGCAVFMVVPHVETTDIQFKLTVGAKELGGQCVGITGQYLTYSEKILEECFKHPVTDDAIDSLEGFLHEPIRLHLPTSYV